MTLWHVPEHLGSLRLDRAVALALGLSRREARLKISKGEVQVRGRICRILTRPLPPNTPISLREGPASMPGVPNPTSTAELVIVELNRWFVVVDKPAGLLSEPDRFGGPSVLSVLTRMLSRRGEHERLWLVHRLDASTSGIMILARTAGVAARLSEAFKLRRVDKTYVALCHGESDVSQRHANGAIARIEGTKHGIQADGRPAHTAFRWLLSRQGCSAVEARPTTGRTHQIRVHLAGLGHPIVGDRLYGGPRYLQTSRDQRSEVGRALLHAKELALDHPKEGHRLTFFAQVPADMRHAAELMGLAQAWHQKPDPTL